MCAPTAASRDKIAHVLKSLHLLAPAHAS
jgi:hypothetical protein